MEKINLNEYIENEATTIEEICSLVDGKNIDKRSVISDSKFKKKLYNELKNTNFSYSSMRSVISTFGPNACIENMDIDEIMGYTNSYRFFSTLTEADSKAVLNRVSNDEKYYKHFFDKVEDCYSILYESDYDDVKNVMQKINSSEEQPKNLRHFLNGINESAKESLLKEELKEDVVKTLLNESGKEIRQNFINKDPRALTMYKDMGVLKMIDEGIKFPKDIMRQKDFFEQLKGKDFTEFRKNINKLYKGNYSHEIENKVKQYREDIIKDFNPETGMFNSYNINSNEELNELDMQKDNYILDGKVKYDMHLYLNDKEKLKEVLQKATSDKLSDVIVDSMFNDTKKNVRININEMVRYNGHLSQEEKILDDNKLEFYQKIKNIDNISSQEKLELYKSLKDENVMQEMYEDISALRNKSYQEIRKSLFKTNDNPEDISLSATEENNVEVYKLTGKPFNMLVRALDTEYREETNNIHSAYSLISGNNTSVFGSSSSFLYGYDDIDPESIVNVFESDSYTMNADENITERPNRIMTPEEITDSDHFYSEINIKNKQNEKYDGVQNRKKYKEMRPSYMVAMDRITDEQVQESKRLGIPLVVVERERYKQKLMDNIEYERYDSDIN